MNIFQSVNISLAGLTTFSLLAVGAMDAKPAAAAATAEHRCRQVHEDRINGLQIRAEPSPYSAPVAVVDPTEEVTLAPNYEATRGPEERIWIEITEPFYGYISNGTIEGGSNLVQCSEDGEPVPDPEPGRLCRRVLGNAGLVVRTEPDSESELIGDIAPNERLSLSEDYESIEGPEFSWVSIAVPQEGFVPLESNGTVYLGYCIDQ